MRFRQTAEGKNVFISIDSRILHHNPLYKAWKAKSFTDGDITLHFVLMDILSEYKEPLSLSDIAAQVDVYLVGFDQPKMFDESTIRKKLKEYASEGIVEVKKQGKAVYYKRSELSEPCDVNVLDYFSEIAPCGVIGSFLLDKQSRYEEMLAFKHHYITGALDSEVMCSLFMAIREKRMVTMETINRHKDRITENHVIPIHIMISAQSGRQYLMAYAPRFDRIRPFRIDNIVSVMPDEKSERFDELKEVFRGMRPHIWGVSTQSRSGKRMEHIEFTIHYDEYERHIHRRLEREKRCGTVEKIDENTSRFYADVYDASELVPWIRTFICRIIDISISDKELESQFKEDINEMYRMYDLEGGGDE